MLSVNEEELDKILPSDGPSIDEVKRYLEKYNDEYIVIKCGGSVLVDQNLFNIQASNARSRSQPRLIAFGLGGDKPTPAWASKYYFKKPMLGKPKEEIYLKGANLFHDYGCEGCHGIGALSIGGDVPDLRKNQYSKDYFRAVMDGALISKGMPEFSFINDLEADAINSFLLYKSWEAFENDATEINK